MNSNHKIRCKRVKADLDLGTPLHNPLLTWLQRRRWEVPGPLLFTISRLSLAAAEEEEEEEEEEPAELKRLELKHSDEFVKLRCSLGGLEMGGGGDSLVFSSLLHLLLLLISSWFFSPGSSLSLTPRKCRPPWLIFTFSLCHLPCLFASSLSSLCSSSLACSTLHLSWCLRCEEEWCLVPLWMESLSTASLWVIIWIHTLYIASCLAW